MGETMHVGRGPEKDEMAFYDAEAQRWDKRAAITQKLLGLRRLEDSWAIPIADWLDNPYDSVAQSDVYEHVRPQLAGGDVLQLGGTGEQALKALIGGARSGCLVTPVQGEAALAQSIADDLGLADRFRTCVAVGEATTLQETSFDVVMSAGCLHHTDVASALVEVRRLLRVGGRFGAWDPWHARLYRLGVAIFGKRERGIECRPLNPQRLQTLRSVFPASEIRLHGAITRYPLVVLGKARIVPSQERLHRWTLADDRFSSRFPAVARNGSSASVLATK